MNPIIYAIPVFLVMIGMELLIARRQGREVYGLHDAITSLNLGVLSQIVGVFSKAAMIGIYAVCVERFGLIEFDVGNPLVWLMALVMYDFCYYWQHRMGHEVNLLWAAHQVHHSSEYYNLSTALRQTSTGFLFSWIFYLPMAILGVPVLVFVVVGLIDLLYQFWVHTEVVRRLGWFDYVFVSPSNHRVHHGQNDWCIDKNYGGIWILWDRWFGTFEDERADEPIVYGVLKPLHSWNPVTANVQGYAQIVHGVMTTPGWRGKLMRIFGSPGWQPLGEAAMANGGLTGFKRYETPSSWWQGAYGVVSFAAMVGFIVHFLMVETSLGPWQSVAYVAVMAAAMLGLGGLFAGARWAVIFEAMRIVVVGVALIAGGWMTPVSVWAQVAGAVFLTCSLLLLWRAQKAPLFVT